MVSSPYPCCYIKAKQKEDKIQMLFMSAVGKNECAAEGGLNLAVYKSWQSSLMWLEEVLRHIRYSSF